MALFRYFKREKGNLPDPHGPLARSVPSTSIAAANSEVSTAIDTASRNSGKRGHYEKYTPQQKAMIGKTAAEHGVAASVRRYMKDFPNLKENTVRDWRNAHRLELKKRGRNRGEESINITELPQKKRGRPLLLGEELDKQVQAYLTSFRESGAVVNTAITMACAEGIVRSADSNLLAVNGGHILITKDWAKNILHPIGFVKRRASTKAKVTVEDFEEKKDQFLLDIKAVVTLEDIPFDLVINWDQTGMHYVPVSSWTVAKEGSKRVEICGMDDKRQITAVFGCTMVGEFLPVQLVYKGKTDKCHPSFQFPSDWNITHSPNHWSNEDTMKDYIVNILVPYVTKKREDLRLPCDHHALVIYDKFKGQCTPAILQLLEENNVDVVFVPANCTDRLQPLDVSVNKAAKDFMRDQFQRWYADQIQQQVHDNVKTPVDLRLSIVKPLSARWFVQLSDYLKAHPDIIKNGFKGAGITVESLSC